MSQTSIKSVSTPATVDRPRAFKTLHFSKAAGKQGISDAELCQAVAELDQGRGDNLGGNVWKKRLKNNLSRSIVLTKPKSFWVFVHIFEKQDKDNIAIDELRGFKKLAKDFGNGGMVGIEAAKQNGSLKELGHDKQA